MDDFISNMLFGNRFPFPGNMAGGLPGDPTDQEPKNVPTSKRVLKMIPNIFVTPEDLADENNRECSICLEW